MEKLLLVMTCYCNWSEYLMEDIYLGLLTITKKCWWSVWCRRQINHEPSPEASDGRKIILQDKEKKIWIPISERKQSKIKKKKATVGKRAREDCSLSCEPSVCTQILSLIKSIKLIKSWCELHLLLGKERDWVVEIKERLVVNEEWEIGANCGN